MSTTLILFLLCLALSAFFAGYQTGFAGVNRVRIRHMADEEKDPKARRLNAYLKRPARMMALVLVGTNLALVAGTMALVIEVGPLWSMAIATPLFLMFGEVAPKSIFRIHPTRLALQFLPAIRFFDFVLSPAVLPFTWFSGRLDRLADGMREGEAVIMSTAEDMRVLVDEGADHGAIMEEEKEMIHSVMDLQSRQVREIMVPRINIVALPETVGRADLIAKLVESGYTRIPVYRDSIDNVVGVINAFDVLRDKHHPGGGIEGLVREVLHVPDTMKLDDLLGKMRESGQPIAVVTDEYGGTDGLITQEDVLEEIFGEFHDEYDKAETRIREISPGAFVIDAQLELAVASEKMGIEIDDAEVETVGGWVTHVVGRIPVIGEVINHPPFRITILEGKANRITRVRVDVRGDIVGGT
jgi:CBS domain containing-hemolysin-like protein